MPSWQKRGSGLYWQDYVKTGLNPVTQQSSETLRRQLTLDTELPFGEDYSSFVQNLLATASEVR